MSSQNPCAGLSRRRSAGPPSWAAAPGRSGPGEASPWGVRCFCRRWRVGPWGEGRCEDWGAHRKGSSTGLSGPESCILQCRPTALEDEINKNRRGITTLLIWFYRREADGGGGACLGKGAFTLLRPKLCGTLGAMNLKATPLPAIWIRGAHVRKVTSSHSWHTMTL